MAAEVGMPLPGLMATANAPVAAVFARKSNATDARVRADLAELPALLDRVDALIDAGTIGADEPNAADFQIGTSVRALAAFDDLAPSLAERPAAQLATRLLPGFVGPIPPTLPRAWLPGRSAGRH
jgi:glutathione S-transferase